jgi:hypothetical protein
MGIQSSKYTTTAADFIRIVTTIDIMRVEYTDMVIGIIIKPTRHDIRSAPLAGFPVQFRASNPGDICSPAAAPITRVASTTIGPSGVDREVAN